MLKYSVNVYADGSKAWHLNGKLHREDGPAMEYADGYKSWYLNNKRLTEEEHKIAMNPPKPSCEGKEVEIDGIVYVLNEKKG